MGKKLKNLKKAAKKLTEASGPVGDGQVSGKTGVPQGGGPEANKGFSSGSEAGSITKDDHSSPVQKVGRDEGVNASGTPQAYEPAQTDMG